MDELRDRFAGMVLQGMLSNPEMFKMMRRLKDDAVNNQNIPALEWEDAVEFPAYANSAYRIADAMIKQKQSLGPVKV